ncbi:MAG: UTP--glucose-1-phosphate uridylyltransferase [Ardenticatenaceae bacterium]|nr:UTP--glucose-1-phosphate uridylyltransferase [Ardenticatenaceae bacterium]MCB8989524.1 UTP--glucose-1-phosphate uridylyltransferase [Ardenticatenaceae bacterium]MCB9003067.1 UTP--glucose-1-phosphate uridylyltransferase [Ardenticatenaceae bacterium]
MRAADLPELFIETFASYYAQLVQGRTGLIAEADITPVETLPDMETLPEELAAVGEGVLAKTAVIKLNGGLGTSMGLAQAKSLLPVRDGLSFLDIIARQALQAGVPLMLMNSFATEADSLALLRSYAGLESDLPLSFVQHKAPKVTQADLTPASWPQDPQLEWCPPGHGDIYTALLTSGALAALRQAGYEYAFVSNADNLGAVIDVTLLGYFAVNHFPFMMEVADRTEMDKKGGHLAQRDGQFILRESAQCPADDRAQFQNIARHQYFNTNNLWLHLPTLQQVLAERGNMLGLPMIRNAKTVDPRDGRSTPVYQLETAMGSAIEVFAGAQAVRVPRTRFAPVKKTDDLLAVRSDAYVLTDAFHIEPRTLDGFVVALDGRYYKFISDLDARFPYGPPSLVDCTHFSVTGDYKFGRNVIAQGEVRLVNETGQQIEIPDGAIL